MRHSVSTSATSLLSTVTYFLVFTCRSITLSPNRTGSPRRWASRTALLVASVSRLSWSVASSWCLRDPDGGGTALLVTSFTYALLAE